MGTQPFLTTILILLSAFLSAQAIRFQFSGYVGWAIANAVVVLCGVLALWFAQDWAGWLTGVLFVLLVACPAAFSRQAARATQRGDLERAAQLLRWAVLLHPSPHLRFRLALARAFSAFGADGEAAALAQIEATGTRSQKALARLMLAHEQRDWESVLNLSRAGTVNASEAKPREIRALGELGRLDEMVQIYGRAGPLLLPQARQECALYVLVFTGRVEGVQQLLNGSLSGVDYDSKTYWLAVARLRRDHNDETARAMLGILRQTATKDRLRRSAVQHLRASEDGSALPPLTEETERAVDAIIRIPLERARTQQRQRLTQRRKAAAWLFLVCIILAVAEGYCSFRHVAGTH